MLKTMSANLQKCKFLCFVSYMYFQHLFFRNGWRNLPSGITRPLWGWLLPLGCKKTGPIRQWQVTKSCSVSLTSRLNLGHWMKTGDRDIDDYPCPKPNLSQGEQTLINLQGLSYINHCYVLFSVMWTKTIGGITVIGNLEKAAQHGCSAPAICN